MLGLADEVIGKWPQMANKLTLPGRFNLNRSTASWSILEDRQLSPGDAFRSLRFVPLDREVGYNARKKCTGYDHTEFGWERLPCVCIDAPAPCACSLGKPCRRPNRHCDSKAYQQGQRQWTWNAARTKWRGSSRPAGEPGRLSLPM